MNTRGIHIGMGMFGVGGLIIALFQIKSDIQRDIYPIDDSAFRGLLFFAILLCVAGVLAILTPLAAYTRNIRTGIDGIRRVAREVVSDPRYDCVPATREQLPAIRKLAMDLIGGEVSSLDDMREWHAKNPTIFSLIVETASDDKEPDIVGYFSILPVTKRTADLLDRGKLIGSGFTSDNIISPGGRAAAMYIGGVAARTPGARTYALASLISRLDARDRNVHVYSRPVTPRGLRLLRKYNFSPIQDSKEGLNVIHRATRPAANRILGNRSGRKKHDEGSTNTKPAHRRVDHGQEST